VIYQGKDPDTGKERRRWYHFPTRKEAEAHLLQLANYPAGAGVGNNGSTRLRLGDFLKSWLHDDAKMAVGPLTYKCYREAVELHIVPELGHYPLARIGPQTIAQFYTKKLESGLAPATVKHMHVALHLGFKKAVEWDLIVRNPCERVRPPKVQRKPLTVWSVEQMNTFLASAKSHTLYPVFVFAAHTGLRLGEILSLKPEDFNLAQGKVYVVRRQKSSHSVRQVDLSPQVQRVVSELLEESSESRVFPFSASYVSHAFVKIAEKAKIASHKVSRSAALAGDNPPGQRRQPEGGAGAPWAPFSGVHTRRLRTPAARIAEGGCAGHRESSALSGLSGPGAWSLSWLSGRSEDYGSAQPGAPFPLTSASPLCLQ
jgi:integrase